MAFNHTLANCRLLRVMKTTQLAGTRTHMHLDLELVQGGGSCVYTPLPIIME